jgi:hypothetical protein
MRDYGNNLSVPLTNAEKMEMAAGRMNNMPHMDEPTGVPMGVTGMAESQACLDYPSLEPASGNQKQPIVKQFNPDARLGGGTEGNQKRPINQSSSRK